VSRALDHRRYAGDVAAYYALLVRTYGYRDDEIRACVAAGGSYPLLDGELRAALPARRDRVLEALAWLAELGEGDRAFIVVTDHGAAEGISLWGKASFLSPADLASSLASSAATKIIALGQCNAGAFGEHLAVCGPAVALCACGPGEQSFGEPRPSRGVDPRYNEFLYQLAGALGGLYPDGRPLLGVGLRSPREITLGEAFRYARDNDRWAPGARGARGVSELPRIYDPQGLAEALVL
jgi:hypothetical protein